METIFILKIWGSYRVYLYAEPEQFDTMIICKSVRIRHQLNTNWYDAMRCNKMQHDGDTMQYEEIWWWWRINTIALWCDENTIGTNRDLHEPCAIQYDNAIVAHHLAKHWVAADRRRIPVRMYNDEIRMYNDEIRSNRNWHELIRRSAMQYDPIRIGFECDMQEGQALWKYHKHFNCVGKIVNMRMILVDPQSMNHSDLVWQMWGLLHLLWIL